MIETYEDLQQSMRRYAEMIERQLANRVSPAIATFGIESGLVLASAILDRKFIADNQRIVEPLIAHAHARGETVSSLTITDRLGHARPLYRPLLVYAWVSAFRLLYETLPQTLFGQWEEALRAWCESLEPALERSRLPEASIAPVQAPQAAEAVFSALALHVAGKVFIRDAWTDIAADAFGRLTRAQQPSGAFVAPDPAAHPEITWYHELAILHAAASFAVQAEDRTVAAAVRRATEYHLAETQPDHATTQPFGLFAFIWNSNTQTLADAMLHNVALQLRQPEGADAVSLILLADCLYCLRLFL
jgi:hypothetical protein